MFDPGPAGLEWITWKKKISQTVHNIHHTLCALPQGSLTAAEEFVAITPDSFMLRQFENKHNPRIHYETTGPEIWAATGGEIDFLVAGDQGRGENGRSGPKSSETMKPSSGNGGCQHARSVHNF